MNRLSIFFGLLLHFTALSSFAQQVISCGTLFTNNTSSTSTFVSNIPPGQTGPKTFHYYGDTYGLPDGVRVYFDNTLVREVWVGWDNWCSPGGSGTSIGNCRVGPTYWTNANQIFGPGTISTIPAGDLATHFANSGLTSNWATTTSPSAFHLEIVVPETVCQIRIQSVTNSNTSESHWQGILQCPNLDCPGSQIIQSQSQCSSGVNLSLPGSCSEFIQNSITWYGPNGFTSSTGATANATVPGDYTASIQYSETCTVNANTIVSPLSFGFDLQTASTPSTCNTGSDGTAAATVNGGLPPFQYQWSNQATTANINNLAPGTYTASVTDANGCQQQQQVTVGAQTSLTLGLQPEDAKCFQDSNGSITSQVGGTHLDPLTYAWQDNVSTPNRTNIPAGNYTLQVTDSRGCSISQNTTVNQPDLLTVSGSTTGTLCEEGNSGSIQAIPAGGTAPYTVNVGGATSSQSPYQFGNLTGGNYTLQVTDQNGCSSSTDVFLGNDPATLKATIEYKDCTYTTRYVLSNSTGVVHEEVMINQNQYSDIDKWVNFSYNGCEFTAQLKWEGPVPINVADVWIPNAFTPDGGQYNNTFFPKASLPVVAKEFMIFDRWGHQVFRETNIILDESYLGWDGTLDGQPVQDGVYTWVANFECDVKKVGHVTLLR